MKKSLTHILTILFLSVSSRAAKAPPENVEGISATEDAENAQDETVQEALQENTTKENSDDELNQDFYHFTPQQTLEIAIKIHEHNEEYEHQSEIIADASHLCFTMQYYGDYLLSNHGDSIISVPGYGEAFVKFAYTCHASFLLRSELMSEERHLLETAREYVGIIANGEPICSYEIISTVETLRAKLLYVTNRFHDIFFEGEYALDTYSRAGMLFDDRLPEDNIVELVHELVEFNHSNYRYQTEIMRNYFFRLSKIWRRVAQECDDLSDLPPSIPLPGSGHGEVF